MPCATQPISVTDMKHLKHVDLKNYSTYRIGGMAHDIYFPETMTEMADLVRQHRAQNRPFWIHGGGANTLFPDGEVHLSIISTSAMTGSSHADGTVVAEAGKVMDAWVLDALRQGFGGIECLSGIPGTLGGALFMNAGAYGQEISDHLVSVTVLTATNEIVELPKAVCGFGYRRADALRGTIILAGTWALPHGEPLLLAKRKEILGKRREKQPLEYPSAGSVFKRPEGVYASQLIDQAGLKGARIGGAQISEKHAGFIVNVGGATCRDVLDLVELCRATIRERFGYELELEQCLCPPRPKQP